MEPSARILTLPNIISSLRLIAIPLVLLCMWERDLTWALLLFITAAVSDFLDGLLARLLKQKTLFGMYLDPIADKLLLSSSFLILAMTGEVPWLVTNLVLARDLAIVAAVVVLRLTTDLRRFPPTFLGKVNTSVQLAVVFAILLDEVYGQPWIRMTRRILLVATPVLVVANSFQYALRTVQWLRRRVGSRPSAVGTPQ